MAHEDDVIEQADALMRRHRSFVARAADAAGTDVDTRPVDDDIPVLTEVVDADDVFPDDVPALLDAVGRDLDEALSDWLVEVLPAAVANASQQVLAELDAKARNTLLPRLRNIIETRRQRAAEGQSL